MLRALLVVLFSADPSIAIGNWLNAPAGSDAEVEAVEALRSCYAEDPPAVEEAIRGYSGFPEAPAGLRSVRISLSGVSVGSEPVADGLTVVRVPSGYSPSRSWPVLLLVHGTGGSGEGLARSLGPLADRLGFLLVAPTEEYGPKDGWGFNEYQHAMHLRALFWLKRNYNVDDARVFVHGGSRGGHASWDLACSYPDLFAGSVPVSGTLANRHMRYLVNLRHVGLFDMQGAKDSANLVENVRASVKRLRSYEYDVTYKEDPQAGHFFPVDWEEVAAWISERRRPDHPDGLVMAATRDERSRCFWIGMKKLPTKTLENPPPAKYDPRRVSGRDAILEVVREHYDKYRGIVRASVADNVIDLRVKRAPRVLVYLDPDLLNLAETVVIKVNGRVRRKGVFPRSIDTLLERVKSTGERRLLYPAVVEVRGGR